MEIPGNKWVPQGQGKQGQWEVRERENKGKEELGQGKEGQGILAEQGGKGQ
jgi:hypothetical protein